MEGQRFSIFCNLFNARPVYCLGGFPRLNQGSDLVRKFCPNAMVATLIKRRPQKAILPPNQGRDPDQLEAAKTSYTQLGPKRVIFSNRQRAGEAVLEGPRFSILVICSMPARYIVWAAPPNCQGRDLGSKASPIKSGSQPWSIFFDLNRGSDLVRTLCLNAMVATLIKLRPPGRDPVSKTFPIKSGSQHWLICFLK